MKFNLKTAIYWLSIVAPLKDIVVGLWEVMTQFPDDVKKIHQTRRYLENVSRYYSEEGCQDMSDEEFDEKFNPTKKKGVKNG